MKLENQKQAAQWQKKHGLDQVWVNYACDNATLQTLVDAEGFSSSLTVPDWSNILQNLFRQGPYYITTWEPATDEVWSLWGTDADNYIVGMTNLRGDGAHEHAGFLYLLTPDELQAQKNSYVLWKLTNNGSS